MASKLILPSGEAIDLTPQERATVTRPVANKICDVFESEFRSLLLSREDEIMILLSAAYGRAQTAGFSRSKLEALRAQVWDILDSTRPRP